MSELSLFFEAFHFLRPLWLLVLPLVALVWWRVRSRANKKSHDNDGLAPHLREGLLLGATSAKRFRPIDSVAAVLILATLGASGPTWSRISDPFFIQTAPLVIVLKVTTSMEATDTSPPALNVPSRKYARFA